eukprot:164329_1
MPMSIYGGSCVLLSKTRTIYYFGGRIQTGYTVKSIFKYQIELNQWTTLSTELLLDIFGQRPLIIHETNVTSYWWTDNGVYLFNALTESIQLVTTMQYDRYASQTALINGHVYIAGGYQSNNPTLVLTDSEWSKEIFYENNISKTSTSISPETLSKSMTTKLETRFSVSETLHITTDNH